MTTHMARQVAVPGTCGELVQGTLEGLPCLVSCPIACYSRAEVGFGPGTTWTVPPAASKTARALQAGLAYLRRAASGGWVQHLTTLPRGRGYGSSTADIGAMLYALGEAAGQPLSPLAVARLAVQVEPTDSSLFPGLALWDHRQGQYYEPLGAAPTLTVVVLDAGGEVDTLAFNRQDHRAMLQRLAPQHRDAFQLLRHGLAQQDFGAIGAAATLSATVHQAILPNPLLDVALALAHDLGAMGICRAHSGTLLGLLLDPRHTEIPHAVALAAQRCGPTVRVFSRPLVGGGPAPT